MINARRRVSGPKASVMVEENRLRVMDVAQEFIDRFTSVEMVQKMPHEMKFGIIFHSITRSLSEKKTCVANELAF